MNATVAGPRTSAGRDIVKCVVWDLDNTLWSGTLLEGDQVALRPQAREAVVELDRRGILQSVASRNDHDLGLARLRALGVDDYFLFPQINWGAKSQSVRRIAQSLGIGFGTVLLVDDEPFERAEVTQAIPQVRAVDGRDLGALLRRPDLTPECVTGDARRRRLMYLADARRRKAEDSFGGPSADFLAGLGMTLTVREAEPGDLPRAAELTVRTNQLNATGYTYSSEELDQLRHSPRHILLVAELTDRFGSYGTIGLALIELTEDSWVLKLLLMSCRVATRGVGAALLHHLMAVARQRGRRLCGEFLPTDRNRAMYIMYRFAGFCEIGRGDAVVLLEDSQILTPSVPAHLSLRSSLSAEPAREV
jgi:FkbH-like protein